MAYFLAQATLSKSSWLAGANTVLRSIVRYLLAVGMMLFGMSKLSNYHFQLPAWVYAKPLAEIGGFGLTWAFLGYQPWFQCDDCIILDGSPSSFQVVLERYLWGKQAAFQSTPKSISKVQ